jgi:flavin-dependent dehydrogenase
MYDAIIVGARCAGSATAITLARAGRRVLLVDKATFPSDTMSTLFLQPGAMVRLEKWGLLERLRATGCPSIRQMRFALGGVAITGLAWSPDNVTEGLSPRRTVLDKILVDAAVAAGAELREAFVFEDVVRDGDRVTGIRGHDKGGASISERARIVIGADGMRSPVARAVGAEMQVERPVAACWYYSFYSGVELAIPEIAMNDWRAVSAWPTNDGNTIVIVGWPIAMWHEVKADLEASFDRALDIAPEIAVRVRAGRREERFVGAGDLAGFVRRSHGPGWALAGDAGYHKDPCTAQGISDALTWGERLGLAIAGALDGDHSLDAATAAYQAARDPAVMPVFDWTCRTAQLRPPEERTKQLLRAVAASPEHTARFLAVLAGTVHASDFFHPDNVARILKA